MAGFLKPNKYDWKDSNLAIFCLEHRQQKKESAETEPAWKNAGLRVGLQIWRIVNLKVTDWPEKDYGKFNTGDSYIVLHTYKSEADECRMSYDVHCWVGAFSTRDKYVTAAFKTAELDAYLSDEPVQYREAEGHESELFRSYFPQGIRVMIGGAKSGLRHNRCSDECDGDIMNKERSIDETFKLNDEVDGRREVKSDMVPHLYRVSDASGTMRFDLVKTGSIDKSDLNDNDAFVIEVSTSCYVWIGSGASALEQHNGVVFAHNHLAQSADPLRPIVVIRSGQRGEEFLTTLAA